MEHEHIIVTELAHISNRMHSLEKHIESDHEKHHFDRACEEIDTLLVLVKQRIASRGVF